VGSSWGAAEEIVVRYEKGPGPHGRRHGETHIPEPWQAGTQISRGRIPGWSAPRVRASTCAPGAGDLDGRTGPGKLRGPGASLGARGWPPTPSNRPRVRPIRLFARHAEPEAGREPEKPGTLSAARVVIPEGPEPVGDPQKARFPLRRGPIEAVARGRAQPFVNSRHGVRQRDLRAA